MTLMWPFPIIYQPAFVLLRAADKQYKVVVFEAINPSTELMSVLTCALLS